MSLNNEQPSGGKKSGPRPRKGPQFNIYWVYAIILVLLLGSSLFGPLNPNMAKINELEFKSMVTKGQVDRYTIIDNRKVVKVYLNAEGRKANEKIIKEAAGKVDEKGPHVAFKITGADVFKKSMDDFYRDNREAVAAQPGLALVKEVPYEVDSDRDWIGGALQFILPVLFFVVIWVLMMPPALKTADS